ncbi:MAG: hypothetical protein OER97_08945 [Gammaproteobacteria bacterium]|nr:hypothetical protein [Gammaproteobacteria bacterium]
MDKKNSNQDGIEFRLKNKEYEFVGFMSPQDRSHHCFEVVDMFDVEYEYEDGEKDGLYSFMTVEDKFCPTETLFDYELVFRKKNGLPEGNLYRYDPQIKNEN